MHYILLLAAAMLFSAAGLHAHEPLLRNIAAVSAEIERTPNDATLYLRRGELHRLHRDWDAARVDFERAATLEPELAAIDFYQARLHLEAGELDVALTLVSRFLDETPDNPLARATRGRVLAELDRPLEAAVEFSRAIELHPTPELYLERADVLVAAVPTHTLHALIGLEQGVARLGPIPALELRVIELRLSRGELDSALAWLDRADAPSKQTIPWLLQRAEILEQAVRNDEALRTYETAYSALIAIPAHRRQTGMFQSFESRITAALERLAVN